MNDLTSSTVKELREVAKNLNIKGRWDMTKNELIEAIRCCNLTEDESLPVNDCNNNKDKELNPEGSQKVSKTTHEYLENAEVGTLIAFKRNANKDIAMSGKYVGTENGKVIIESKKGTLFRVSPENIIWVKTGDRWPGWVFSLFNRQGKEEDNDNAIPKVEK